MSLQTYTEKGVVGNCRLQGLAEDPRHTLPKSQQHVVRTYASSKRRQQRQQRYSTQGMITYMPKYNGQLSIALRQTKIQTFPLR